MATRKKFNRKELKEPDQFISTSEKIIHYIENNAGTVIVLIVIGIVFAGAAWGVKYNLKSKAMDMENVLFDMSQLAKEKKDPKEILPELAKKYEELDSGEYKRRAGFLLAETYYKNGQYDDAIKVYESIMNSTSQGEMDFELAQLGVGQSQVGKKSYKEAIGTLKGILQSSTTLPLFYVYLDLAGCYEEEGDKENALLILREAQNKYPSHMDLPKIESQILKLEAKA